MQLMCSYIAISQCGCVMNDHKNHDNELIFCIIKIFLSQLSLPKTADASPHLIGIIEMTVFMPLIGYFSTFSTLIQPALRIAAICLILSDCSNPSCELRNADSLKTITCKNSKLYDHSNIYHSLHQVQAK